MAAPRMPGCFWATFLVVGLVAAVVVGGAWWNGQLRGGMLVLVLNPVVFLTVGGVGLWSWSKRRNTPAPEDPGAAALTSGPVAASLRRFGAIFFGGFIVTAGLSFGLVIALWGQGAPFWLVAIGFFAPMVVFMVVFAIFFHRRGAELLKTLQRGLPSPESTAAPSPGEVLRADDGPPDEWPNVPAIDLSASPGRSLAYRLPTSDMPGCEFVMLLFGTLFWNGVLYGVFILPQRKALLGGQFDWWLLFFVPFVLAGLVLIVLLLRALGRVLVALLVGGVRVEVSAHPLRPGGRYELLVEQSGLVRLARVGVELACEESATYSQGTSSVTARKTVFTATVFDPGQGWFDGRQPVRLEVPAGVMHSFEAAHNRVGWVVLVHGRALGLPYRRAFPVVILPE